MKGHDMADPIARLEWMGKQVVCYLQPGCRVSDMDALVGDISETCTACCTETELEAEMDAVAAKHHLRLAPRGEGVPSDPVERILSFGFLPPMR